MSDDELICASRHLQGDAAELAYEAIFDALDANPGQVGVLLTQFENEPDLGQRIALAVCITRVVAFPPADRLLRLYENWTDGDFDEVRAYSLSRRTGFESSA